MNRVILTLLTLIQCMFFVNVLLNEGVIFFNIYIWGVVTLTSLIAGVISFNSSSSNIDDSANNYFALSLITISIVSIGYIIYLVIFKPFYL